MDQLFIIDSNGFGSIFPKIAPMLNTPKQYLRKFNGKQALSNTKPEHGDSIKLYGKNSPKKNSVVIYKKINGGLIKCVMKNKDAKAFIESQNLCILHCEEFGTWTLANKKKLNETQKITGQLVLDQWIKSNFSREFTMEQVAKLQSFRKTFGQVKKLYWYERRNPYNDTGSWSDLINVLTTKKPDWRNLSKQQFLTIYSDKIVVNWKYRIQFDVCLGSHGGFKVNHETDNGQVIVKHGLVVDLVEFAKDHEKIIEDVKRMANPKVTKSNGYIGIKKQRMEKIIGIYPGYEAAFSDYEGYYCDSSDDEDYVITGHEKKIINSYELCPKTGNLIHSKKTIEVPIMEMKPEFSQQMGVLRELGVFS
jgi:hypothetical protein